MAGSEEAGVGTEGREKEVAQLIIREGYSGAGTDPAGIGINNKRLPMKTITEDTVRSLFPHAVYGEEGTSQDICRDLIDPVLLIILLKNK
jgi:hypothetical protein